MNIFKREMKTHRKALIWWCVGMFFMIWGGMTKYGAYEKSGQQVNELFKGLPKSLSAVFGIGDVDLTTAIGFFSILFLYLIVMGAIHATLLGAGILTEEELDRTAEFLYSKPVSRVKAVGMKLAAAFTNVLLLNIFTSVTSILIVEAFNKGKSVSETIILLMVGLFIVQVLFMSIGAAVAAVLKKPKLAAPVASAYMFGAYFLSLWLDITEKFQNLKYLTPFKYFDSKVIVNESTLDPVFITISVAIIVVMLVLTFVFYRIRDLHI